MIGVLSRRLINVGQANVTSGEKGTASKRERDIRFRRMLPVNWTQVTLEVKVRSSEEIIGLNLAELRKGSGRATLRYVLWHLGDN